MGGPAEALAECATLDELRDVVARAQSERIPVFLLGGGSNLLVSDDGYDGLVVRITDDFLDLGEGKGRVLVRAGAGLEWDVLVERTVEAGLGGLECLSGIPGRVGAAPIQNIGAYGQEVAETIDAVHVLELASGEAGSIPPRECGFGYRRSHFKGPWRGRYAIVGVDFRLRRRTTGTVRYTDLRRRFGDETPSLAEVRRAVLEIRRGKSMVIDPGDPNRRSAGSFFTNPVVTPAVAEAVRERCADAEHPMPAFPAAGGVKLSAAWLIERAGFQRGYRRGRAGLSSRHVLAVINTGGATAAEIVALAAEVRRGVREQSGVTLVPEPVFLGFGDDAGAVLDRIEQGRSRQDVEGA